MSAPFRASRRTLAAIDRDRDGRLSPDELRSWNRGKGQARKGEGGLAEHFRRADANGDGALTRPELDASLARLGAKFDRIDADRDGGISRGELERYFDARRTALGKPPG